MTGCLLGGRYEEDVTFARAGSSTAPITLRTAPGYRRSTIHGYTQVKSAADYVTVDNVAFDGTAISNSVVVQIFGNHVHLTNCDVYDTALEERTGVILGDAGGTYGVATYTEIDHCRIHGFGLASGDNLHHGIYVNASRYAYIHDNYIYDNLGGWGIHLWTDAQHGTFTHNVVDGNGAGNIIVAGARSPTGGPSSDNVFQGNIVSSPRSGYNFAWFWEGDPGTNNVVTGNCLWPGSGGNVLGPPTGLALSGNIVAQPRYVDREHAVLRLQSSSPCAGFGVRRP
jgi:hypothetical protein